MLDNWGDVSAWTATAPVTSNGPSGIGFVNFGNIERLDVQAPIQTNGKGARGFNLYDGSLRQARFASVATVEIEGLLNRLEVRGGISASGKGSDAVHVTGDVPGLDSIELHAADGYRLVRSS